MGPDFLMAEKGIRELVELMERLRGPSGCPWDREQTFQSLVPYIIEEAHEVVETIEEGDMERLKEELGDLIFQVVFLSQIAKEEGLFDIEDVIRTAYDKMVRRHPHVFGKEKANDSSEALHRWQKAKGKEKEGKEGIFSGIPSSLPALIRAQKVSEKVSILGFDWEDKEGVLEKLEEEIYELKESIKEGIKERIEEEFGDILFTLTNVGRFLDINSERALRRCINRFIRRFNTMVESLKKEGKRPKDLSSEELEEAWQRTKKETVGH